MMGSGSKCRVLVGSCIQRCKGTSVYNSRVPVEIWPGTISLVWVAGFRFRVLMKNDENHGSSQSTEVG